MASTGPAGVPPVQRPSLAHSFEGSLEIALDRGPGVTVELRERTIESFFRLRAASAVLPARL